MPIDGVRAPAESCDPAFAGWRKRIEATLSRALPNPTQEPERLIAAMRYAALGEGKRMRPLLVYATGHALGADLTLLDAPAVAVELMHAYSLVHDDLPSMDDDALRRGRATVHVAFDEATAILAGDALQTLAFDVLATAACNAELRIALIATLTSASGPTGMCGGQALDLAATGAAQTLAQLEHMHSLKTGALIRACIRMGALCAHADAATLQKLDDYAAALGLAFQIRDDLLDGEGDSEALGKTAGKDMAQSKSTYPALLGIERSRALLGELTDRMVEALAPLGPAAEHLRSLAEMAVSRNR